MTTATNNTQNKFLYRTFIVSLYVGTIFTPVINAGEPQTATEKERIAVFTLDHRAIPRRNALIATKSIESGLNTSGAYTVVSTGNVIDTMGTESWSGIEGSWGRDRVANIARMMKIDKAVFGRLEKGEEGYQLKISILDVKQNRVIAEMTWESGCCSARSLISQSKLIAARITRPFEDPAVRVAKASEKTPSAIQRPASERWHRSTGLAKPATSASVASVASTGNF